MTEADKPKFLAIMQGLAANYGRALDKPGLDFFFSALSGYPIEQLDAAALSIAITRKYTSMPTIADFVEHLSGGNLDDLAEVEAGKVIDAISHHGGYNSVVFDDPATQAVIVQAYGGWPKLCEDCGSIEHVKWFRKDFIKTWAAYKRQGIHVYGYLPGNSELQNRAAGWLENIPRPALVGNPQKAAAILTQGQPQAQLPPAAAREITASIQHAMLPSGDTDRQ